MPYNRRRRRTENESRYLKTGRKTEDPEQSKRRRQERQRRGRSRQAVVKRPETDRKDSEAVGEGGSRRAGRYEMNPGKENGRKRQKEPEDCSPQNKRQYE